ncbi:MAG: AzlD domain-containing protein [Eubacteriales bacterium]|nr:AzlD domain-containing protein [Eubacteriales bacterium]
MNSTNILVLIVGMALVTYIPRAIPAVLIDKMRFGAKMEKFLKLIPYTAMSALIFPGVFTVDTSHPSIGIVGGAVAGVLAWKKCPVMICVLAAIAADFVLYLILGS